MSESKALDAEKARILRHFTESGADLIDTPILQPAGILLELYGEDIRARAYTTRDPLAGEMMLRPDFTVPLVQQHSADRRSPARYAYSGKVFRVQEMGADHPSEYDQVGYEIFEGKNVAAADAEVFALFAKVLAPLNLRAATGDIGVLMAAVKGLDASNMRKAALMRHIWRPRRFRALLDRFAGNSPVPRARAALLARCAAGEDVLSDVPLVVGARGMDEVKSRIDALVRDAAEPPLSAIQVELLDQIVKLNSKAPEALESLRDIAVDLPAILPAVARLDARLDALAARDIDVAALDFEGSYGRTSMEYYDGFVFGFYSDTRPDLPVVATGGRYDALTRAIGGEVSIPAVGGVIRPSLTLELGA